MHRFIDGPSNLFDAHATIHFLVDICIYIYIFIIMYDSFSVIASS